MRMTLVEESGIHLEYELYEGSPYIHVEITEWSPSKCREYIALWEDIKTLFRLDGFKVMRCGVLSERTLNIKFVGMFGFNDIECQNDQVIVFIQEI